jgi:peptide/nickel transport system substrate-binding protein
VTARAAQRGIAATLAVGCAMLVSILSGCTTKQADATGVTTERGGTLHVLLDRQVEAWDPQRIGTPADAAFAVRTFVRTLTSQAPTGVGFLPGLVGDLSTTTGVAQDGGRTWIFSLVSDAPWQDGRFVSCADVKYGVSRNFATDRITGGTHYAFDLLDIPSTTDAQGRTVSAYEGPYSGVGQALYDKAVTCDGPEIAFHLKAPRSDFDEIVSLPEFGPARQDQDTDRTNGDPLSVFASGPYMLEGVWKPGEGGRFVRNRKWVARDDPVRSAWPDVIEVEEALPTTTVAQRLLDSSGDDATAITTSDAPMAMDAQLRAPGLAGRVSRPDGGVVDALLPDIATGAMGNPAVRRAFAVATSREAYATGAGGPMSPSTSTLAHGIPGRPVAEPIGISVAGDSAGARAVLTGAGITTPVPLRLGYAPSESATRALTALLPTWEQAGFAVALVATATATAPTAGPVDVQLTQVSAAYPSGGSVLPSLVRRVGDPGLTAVSAAAEATSDTTARDRAWGDLDATLTAAGDVVPLAERGRVLLRGTGVEAYQVNVRLAGLPDLASISVTR